MENIALYFKGEERERNGIVFTPRNVADEVIKNVDFSKLTSSSKIIDPSVGSGALLISFLTKMVTVRKEIDLKYFVENNIYGLDIKAENTLATNCALSIFMELQGYDIDKCNFIQVDSLKIPDLAEYEYLQKSFDIVLGNPPYVRARKMTEDYRCFLRDKWDQVIFGLPDLYMPFFALANWLLKDEGTIAYITPNSFFSSLNGKKLRSFIVDTFNLVEISDYKHNKLFGKNVMTYSTIICLKKLPTLNGCTIQYNDGENTGSVSIENSSDQWRLVSKLDYQIIQKMEEKFTPLKDLDYKNGIATQRNSIYDFVPEDEDDKYYFFENQKIEKEITRNFVLPNKSSFVKMKIIFPYFYDEKLQKNVLISEGNFKQTYSGAYSYLYQYKDSLLERKSDSDSWYAYGRSQGIQKKGNRLYIPYMAKNVKTIISTDVTELFAAGYAIFSDNVDYLKFLQSILESKVFFYYLQMVSKPYSEGYYSTSKTMIQNFSVPNEKYFEQNKNSLSNISSIEDLYELSFSEKEQMIKK